MTSRNAAVYGTCGVVLIACLAAANMPSQDSDLASPRLARPAHVAPDAIAADVRSQAARLHARMADPPTPAPASRNPFAFGLSRARIAPPPAVEATIAAEAPPPAPAIPLLVLMGIAEQVSASGPHRTAIIGGDGDTIYMVVEGDPVAGRYTVTKIGADAVELEDQTTKAYRRIALR